jgi:formyltetrahydrofolate deformylase
MNFRSVLVLRCPERKGIVSAVSGFLAEQDYTITDSGQYRDPANNTFFMRVVFSPLNTASLDLDELRSAFLRIASDFAMDWTMHDLAHRPRVLILVSRFGHCLNDLLHRWRTGLLPVDIVGVVSNHSDLRSFVEWHGLPFHHLPVSPETKAAQEAQIKALVEETRAELVVLARYMHILSDGLAAYLAGRCINIHHSFLPSFKGAKPYHQAHARGVKMIGATSHYVTADLDEGPIIAQDARHVDHAPTPEELVALGQEVECAVLARAVGWHVAHRIIGNGRKTVVFT